MSEINPVIRFNNVRLAFPHLLEKHTPPGSPGAVPAYSGDFIIDPVANKVEWEKMGNTVAAMAQEKWPEIWQQVLEVIKGDRKLRCYGSGEEKKDKRTMQTLSGYEGKRYISGRNRDTQPDFYDQHGDLIDLKDALADNPTFYGGCYVNVAIKLWLQDNTHGRGVRGDLIALQFVRDGEPFASHHIDTSGMFSPVEGAPEPTAGSFEPEEGAPANPVSFL